MENLYRLLTYGGGGKIILPENKVVVTDEQGNLSTADISTKEVEALSGLSGNVQDQIEQINAKIDKIGNLLYSSEIKIGDKDILIPGLNEYTFFCCIIASNYNSGVGIGIKVSQTEIRVFGGSWNGSSAATTAFLKISFKENVVTNISGIIGDNARGISNIRGIF